MFQRVKAGEGAAAFVECADGVHAAREADVQVQGAGCAGGGCVRPQRCQRVVVAGVHGQHMGTVVKRYREGALQVGVQGGNLGGQPRLRLPLCPQQLGAKFTELGRLPLAPDDEFSTQLLLPPLEGPPHVSVRHAQRARCGRDGALLRHGFQHFRQGIANLGIARVAAQGVVELDPMHRITYRWRLAGCIR